jgi:hypothetical protein
VAEDDDAAADAGCEQARKSVLELRRLEALGASGAGGLAEGAADFSLTAISSSRPRMRLPRSVATSSS